MIAGVPNQVEAGGSRLLRRLMWGIVAVMVAVGPAASVSPAAGEPIASKVPAVAKMVRVAAAVPRMCSSTPFRSSPVQHRWFRIPAIVRTNAGTLVAFAERRNTDSSDVGNFDVVSARSTDRGCTWSRYTVIGDDATNRVSNPVPLLDATTGAILLFSVVTPAAGSNGGHKGLYLQNSTDDGISFSPLLGDPVRPAGAYRGGLTGPGHGIQLTVTHPGRLILPMGYKTPGGQYGAYGIYSDDHGTTWQTGFNQRNTNGKVKFIEGTIAELRTGDLFISFRDKRVGARAGTARQYAVSTDGGTSLSAKFRPLPLKIVSVEGSALALRGVFSNELLFSAPADTDPYLRRDMTIFVSKTAGLTWPRSYQVQLEDTPGSYSDLVQLDDTSVGVLYETGTATWKERIAFQSIEIPALTQPMPVTARLSYDRSALPTKASAKAKVLTRVLVAGITSPPGRVTLRYVGNGQARAASVQLSYANRGVRAITLPKLPTGNYRLTLTYSGTGRITPSTTSAGTLHVVHN